MKGFKSKPVEPLTVEQVRADKPDMSEETARAVVNFTEHVTALNVARREAHKALPLRTRVGLWWASEAYPLLRLVFKGALLVTGWLTVFDWIGGGQGVLGYALRIGWLLVGLIGLREAMDKA